MRADRLVSLLLLLQTRGRMTAQQLAVELEVSERTIYRDIDALSFAGIPVYGIPGREGGYALLDGYRTTLTGFSAAEVRALLLLSLPTPLTDLGIGGELTTALLKLNAALPAGGSESVDNLRNRVLLDPSWWEQSEVPAPHLPEIHRAVLADRRLRICYRIWSGPNVEREVDPYALVAKAGVWYLVCRYAGQMRVHRVSELGEVQALEEGYERTGDFDLAAFWAEWCTLRGELRSTYEVTVRVSPSLAAALPRYFGPDVQNRLEAGGHLDLQGWATLELRYASLEEAREQLLGLGGAVEVLGPYALRASIQDYAQRIQELYTSS